MGGLAWERGPLHRLPGGEERPTEGEAGYGDPPSAPDPQPQGRPGINPRVTRGGARHRLSHQQRSSSMNAHARPPLWCRSGAHIHMCAEQHPTLTHISRRSQDVGSFKSVEAQGLDSRPLLSPEGLGTIRALHADASLTDTGANPPQVTHNCAARLAPPGRGQRRGAGPRPGLSRVPGLQRLQCRRPRALGQPVVCRPRALGQPVVCRRGGRLPGSLATEGLRGGSCLSGMTTTITQPPPTPQHEAGKEEAHCHGHTP